MIVAAFVLRTIAWAALWAGVGYNLGELAADLGITRMHPWTYAVIAAAAAVLHLAERQPKATP